MYKGASRSTQIRIWQNTKKDAERGLAKPPLPLKPVPIEFIITIGPFSSHYAKMTDMNGKFKRWVSKKEVDERRGHPLNNAKIVTSQK